MEPTALPPRNPDDDVGVRVDEPLPWTFALVGMGALVVGLGMASGGAFAFSADKVAAGLGGQLGSTLPAALIVLVAAAVNAAAGAVLLRWAAGRPFETPAEALLGGFVGAVLLDVVLLGALGGTGTFRWPVLAGLHVLILAAGILRLRPILAPRPVVAAEPGQIPAAVGGPGADPAAGPGRWRAVLDWWPLWLLVGLTWSGVLILQLASPVVPFIDVLPNHVAPVEHLRTFGDFATLTTTASPIYGPSRTFLGYVALLGVVDTLSTLPAALAVAAFALPGAIAVAAGIHRLGGALGGGRTGAWAVLAFGLTTSFVRLPDARATVLVLPLAAWSLALVADRIAGRRAASTRDSLLLGATLAATVLFHPVIGVLTVLAAGLTVVVRPARCADLVVPALAAASFLALPQLATMTEQAVPTAAALLVIPPALGACWLLARFAALRRWLVPVGQLALVLLAALVAILIGPSAVWAAATTSLGKILPTLPVSGLTALLGLLVVPRRLLSPVLLCALAAGAIAAIATELVPTGGTLVTALRFEVPKTLYYWLPVVVALGAAIALDGIWSEPHVPWVAGRLAVVLFLVAAIVPIRQEPLTDAYYLGERRASETLALQLRTAQYGYWQGYPDARRILVPDQQAIVEALRAEIAAGRLGATTPVLHVARSFQQWVSIPLGVFAGVTETFVSPDAEVSIHTVGGRLNPLTELPALLKDGYPYVVLEPSGIATTTRDGIVAAGYRSIFSNARGELFVRGL